MSPSEVGTRGKYCLVFTTSRIMGHFEITSQGVFPIGKNTLHLGNSLHLKLKMWYALLGQTNSALSSVYCACTYA